MKQIISLPVLPSYRLERPRIVCLIVVAGALTGALLIGLIVATERIDPLLLLGALIGLPAGLLWITQKQVYEIGLVAMVLAAGMLNFFTLPTGTASRLVISLVIALVLIGLWGFQLLVIDRRIHLLSAAVNRPVLAFIAVSILSYIWGTLLRDPLVWVPRSWPIIQGASLLVNIVLLLLVLLVANRLNDLHWLETIVWLLISIGAVVGISELLHLPLLRFYFNGSRGLFSAWVAILAYAQALFNKRLDRPVRVALLGVVAIWIIRGFVLNTIWLSGWLPLMAGLAVVTWLRSKHVFAVGLVLVLAYLALNYSIFYEKVFVANVDEGGLQRLDIWRMNLGHVANHPLLGMGPAGYAVYNMHYHPLDARSTHNNYFDVLAQTGVVGLGIFIWLLVSVFRTGYRLRHRLYRQHDFYEAFASSSLGGWAAVVVAMMLGDWVLPFAYNQTISGFDNAMLTWLLWGGLAAAALRLKPSTQITS